MLRKALRSHYFNLSLLFFGFGFAFTFQLSNLSSTFHFIGTQEQFISFIWVIPPLTGMLIQPIVGKLSDNTLTVYGKRRPYILGWLFFSTFSFLMLPFSSSFASILVFTFIIDCGLNGSIEGVRALTGDIFSTRKEKTEAFALQAVSAGLGGTCGAYLPYFSEWLMKALNQEHQLQLDALPFNLKLSFISCGFLLTSILIYSFFFLQEERYPHERVSHHILEVFKRKIPIFIYEIFQDIKSMPKDFIKIFFIHSISWIGIFIFWLYFSIALAQNLYGLPLEAFSPTVKNTAALHRASLDSSILYTIYQNVSLIYAFCLFLSAGFERPKLLHGLSLIVGGIGMACIFIDHHFYSFVLSAIAFGILWGSLITLPYTIVLESFPKNKIGIYLGVFNICITIPQLLCGLTLSPLYGLIFHYSAALLLSFGGFLLILSGALWLILAYQEKGS